MCLQSIEVQYRQAAGELPKAVLFLLASPVNDIDCAVA